MKPAQSKHFESRLPSSIRQAQITFSQRSDKNSIQVINVAIGNVSLPMHPKMQLRMRELGKTRLADGIVKYTPTIGTKESRDAFIKIISADIGFNIKGIHCSITDGGSQAMEIMMLGVCGPSSKKPLMIFDPAYTNYLEFGKRLSVPIITFERTLMDNGEFEGLDLTRIEESIKKNNPAGLLLIPYDNPTGQLLNKEDIIALAKLCVKYNIWLISDEAYRGLSYRISYYSNSIWSLNTKDIPGLEGRRISIESSSKIWNACGLRIGGLVTDNFDFHEKSIFEYTANLSANSIGQEIFGALAYEKVEDLNKWMNNQRKYYNKLMTKLRSDLLKQIPGLIVSLPQASIYLVIDFRKISNNNFNSIKFVKYCASKGKVYLNGKYFTLLMAPMERFYTKSKQGKTQLRLAIVEAPDLLFNIPKILHSLYLSYSN